jgi:hypothetical protein
VEVGVVEILVVEVRVVVGDNNDAASTCFESSHKNFIVSPFNCAASPQKKILPCTNKFSPHDQRIYSIQSTTLFR